MPMSLENNKRQVFAEGGFLQGPFKLQEEDFDEIELMYQRLSSSSVRITTNYKDLIQLSRRFSSKELKRVKIVWCCRSSIVIKQTK
jgi:hypothetical protein